MKKISVDVKDIFDDDVLAKLPKMTSNELKVLAYCVVYSGMEFDGKMCKGHFFKSNASFMNDVGICKQSWFNAINGLIKKGLIKRKAGYRTGSGIDNVASEYIIPNELTELNPLKMTLESDDFCEFSIDDEKGLKEDLDPIIHNNINSYNHNNINSYFHKNINTDFHKTEEHKNINSEEQKKDINNDLKNTFMKKPSNLKELNEYIKEKAISLSKGCSTIEEYEGLKNQLIHEIESEYSHIMSYKSCIYSINGYFNKKEEDMTPTGVDPVGTLFGSMPC